MDPIPAYLADYSEQWQSSPREANLAWFKDAAFGMFIHYGLYSQLARGEWVMFREQIPVADYEQLFDTFDPSGFDADFITDLALDAGMTYINLTACHHEGFCLFDSPGEPFNSVTACGRDLVAELAAACGRKGLGLFTYFTYVLNWRHPHSLTRDVLDFARPNYQTPEPRYELTDPAKSGPLWQWSLDRIAQLCRLPHPLAGIWLDIVLGYYQVPDLVPVADTYRLIRQSRPETLVSFKQGATGEEDFAAPEFHAYSLANRLRGMGNDAAAELADRAWEVNRDKHNEICMTLQDNGAWGYHADSGHRSGDTLWRNLAYARSRDCNLLANVGPLPDGSILPADIAALREVGKRIRENGLPGPDDAMQPGAEES